MANKEINLKQISTKDSNFINKYSDISMTSKFDSISKKFKIEKNVDVLAVKNSIKNIFTWIKGERVLDPNFGTDISKILYDPINSYSSEKIIAEIQMAISEYEPRAEIDKIYNLNSINNTENNTIEIEIVWHVVGLPDEKYLEKIVL